MSAYGIAGLVDGFFKGRELKNGWEDRKDAKERQKKMDGFYADEQGRVAERHGWARDNYGRAVSDYDRARADDDAYRKAAQEAYDAANELGVRQQQGDAGAQTGTSRMDGPPAGPAAEVAANLGAAVDGATRRSASTDEFAKRFDPNAPLGARPDQVPAGPRRADASPQGPDWEAAGRGSQPQQPQSGPSFEYAGRGDKDVMNDPRLQAAQGIDPRAAFNPERMGQEHQTPFEPTEAEKRAKAEENDRNWAIVNESAKGPRATQEQVDAARDMALGASRRVGEAVAPSYEHDFGESFVPDAQEAAKRGLATAGSIATAPVRGTMSATQRAVDTVSNAVTPVIDEAIRYITGAPRPQASAPDAAQSISPAAPNPAVDITAQSVAAAKPALGPRISNVPASAPQAVKDLANTATEAMGAASTPAVEAAAAATAKDGPALGAAGKRPYTEKQRERASTSFLDRYREVGAPIVIKEFLRRGQVDKAVAFQEFMDKGEVKAGMKNWARASFAASVGDFDSFASEIMEGYNRLDYFGDDTTIVTEQSGFTDAKGNVTNRKGDIAGAKIVFRDEKTGKTFEQTYDNPDDIVTMGITLLAPEQAFEYWMQKTEAAKAAALGAAKAGADSRADLDKRIDGQVKIILEASQDTLGNPTISYEEARAQAEAALTGASRPDAQSFGAPTDTPAMPPVLRRP